MENNGETQSAPSDYESMPSNRPGQLPWYDPQCGGPGCDSGSLWMFCGIVPKLTQGRNVGEDGEGVNFFPFSDTGVHYLSEGEAGTCSLEAGRS